MVTVIICSDFRTPKNKVFHCFHCFSIYFPWSNGTSILNLELMEFFRKHIKKSCLLSKMYYFFSFEYFGVSCAGYILWPVLFQSEEYQHTKIIMLSSAFLLEVNKLWGRGNINYSACISRTVLISSVLFLHFPDGTSRN